MLRELLRDFADETDIFGLHLFKRKRTTFDVVFWCSFVLIFSCYTTKTLVNICARYINEEVFTVVHQQRAENFVFPAPQLRLFYGTRHSGVDQEKPLQAMIAEYVTTGDLRSLGDLFYAIEFVNQLRSIESMMATPADNQTAILAGSKLALPNVASGIRAFSRFNSSLANFVDFVYLKLCNASRIHIAFFNSSWLDLVGCKRSKIGVYPASDTAVALYVEIDETKFSFRHSTDKLEIAINTSAISEALHFDVESAWFDVDFGEAAEPDSRFEILLNANRTYFVRMTAAYLSLDLRRRRCATDRKRRLDCRGLCASRFFFESWDCWPMWYPNQVALLHQNITVDVRRCEVEDYLSAANTSASKFQAEIDLMECSSTCIPACSIPIFSTTSDTLAIGEMTAVNIVVRSFVYPLFEERLADDFETVLADFGGALGLWLGASFAAIVHVPVFVLQAIVCFLWSRKKNEDTPAVELREPEKITAERFEALEAATLSRLQAIENLLEQRGKTLAPHSSCAPAEPEHKTAKNSDDCKVRALYVQRS